jgi:hypothetical protein
MTGNPLLAFATQTETSTIYGPVYTWLSAATVALAPYTPLATAFAWKIVSALAALACALLAAPVARAIAGGDEDGTHARLLLAWNPLLIVESAGAAHIEPIMMALALAGLHTLLARNRPGLGSLALLASALTKWVTGLLLVLVWAREIHRALVLRGGAQFGDLSRRFPPQWLLMTAFAAVVLAGTAYAMRRDWRRVLEVATVLLLVFVVAISPWIFPWYFVAPVVIAAILPRDRAGFVLRALCFGLAAVFMAFYAQLRPLS